MKQYVGVYAGGHKELLGERALLMDDKDGDPKYVLAQFNNIETGYGYGWTRFERLDWIRVTPLA